MNGNDDGSFGSSCHVGLAELQNPDQLLDGLSQDQIEWNEGTDVDLRTLYASPPVDGSNRTPNTNRNSSSPSKPQQLLSSQNSSLFLGKTKRRNNPSKDSTTRMNLDRTFQGTLHHNTMREDRMAGAAEKEIDEILGIVQKEQETGGVAGGESKIIIKDTPDKTNDKSLKRRNSSPSETSTQPRDNKRRATGGLRRRRSHPPHKSSRSSSSNALRQRLRRRRMERKRKKRPYHDPTELGAESTTRSGPSTDDETDGNGIGDDSQSQSTKGSTGDDEFTELLHALKTPKDTRKFQDSSSSRQPLTIIDGNVPDTIKTDETATLVAYSESKTVAPHVRSQSSLRVSISPQPPTDTTMISELLEQASLVPNERKLRSSQSIVNSSSKNCPALKDGHNDLQAIAAPHPGEKHQILNSLMRESNEVTEGIVPDCNGNKDGDDEFDDVTFTTDDLAKIDSIVGASTWQHRFEREPKSDSIRLDLVEDYKIGTATGASSNDPPIGCAIEGASDESMDTQDDFDFAKIDALVAEKVACDISTNNPNMLTTTDKISGIHGAATNLAIHKSTRLSVEGMDQQKEFSEDDEYEDLPKGVDFDQIDAMIASQTKRNSDSSQRKSPNDQSRKRTQFKKMDDVAEGDDFDDFPSDIDFADIDALIENRREEEQTHFRRCDKVFEITPSTRVEGNTRADPDRESRLSFTCYTRYLVLRVTDEDVRKCTKVIHVASWDQLIHGRSASDSSKSVSNNSHNTDSDDGYIRLCGEWYHTPIHVGDVVNLCSLYGRYRTDKSALPVTLHTYQMYGTDIDDLVLVLHPDMMMTPSTISEASYCNRRAVLKAKLGSTGLTSKAAFVGTVIHGVFGECLSKKKFDFAFAQDVVKQILRENVETLIGCECSESEIEADVRKVLPMIKQFALQYTNFIVESVGHNVGGVACHPDIHFLGKNVHSVEESIVSTELGLRGDIDAVLKVETSIVSERMFPVQGIPDSPGPSKTLMCLELKTGHNQQAQLAHLAQLSLYTFMLQSRYGTRRCRQSVPHHEESAASGGVLLYLNEKDQAIYHTALEMNEAKTLISQRNVVASNLRQALRPRRISLSYEDGKRDFCGQGEQAKIHPSPPSKLPELKDNDHACKRCFSNRECMLYAASDPYTDNRSHHELMSQFVGQLDKEDLEYFRKWDRLIDMEADSTSTGVASAWLVDSNYREALGDSISGLILVRRTSNIEKKGSSAILSFQREDETVGYASLENLGFSSGCNVVVSSDSTLKNSLTETPSREKNRRYHMHLVRGRVHSVTRNSILVSCKSGDFSRIQAFAASHRRTRGSELIFRIDKNQGSVGTGTLRWNLINFLTGDTAPTKRKTPTEKEKLDKARLPWLRDVIINLRKPKFDSAIQHLFQGEDNCIPGCSFSQLSHEFQSFNDAQQNAVCKTMAAKDYTLIQGLPGTGKSSTLSFLARLLVARGKRVLVTAYTHSAVDNIMLKLMEQGMANADPTTGKHPLVRVGNAGSCHEDVKRILYMELALDSGSDGDISAASLLDCVSGASIVGVSALSLPRSQVLSTQNFDVVIVDEAGQMNQPATLGALMAASQFVLVGDHKQLPPLVNSEIAEQGGFGVSMLSRLAEMHPAAVAPLTLQYRMNDDICKISSEAFYGGMMKCGDERTGTQRLDLPGFPGNLKKFITLSSSCWISDTIDPKKPVVFANTDGMKVSQNSPGEISSSQEKLGCFVPLEGNLGGRVGGSIVNRTEASIICCVIEAMVDCGVDVATVGVISPFRAQIRILEETEKLSTLKRKGLEMSTIDRYQGRDKQVIILSMVRSNLKGVTGRLLQDSRRLNVALTRAKSKLVIVGSFQTLCEGSPPLKPILNRMRRRDQILDLAESANE